MLFHDIWITRISSCLTSASFSFVVNGQYTSWIKSSRGVCQGDPVSPLLFLLVSKNLTTILNKALHLDMIHGFNGNLTKNFNHLIFASKVSMRTARNCLICLNVYQNLTRQKINLLKFALYVPSWCNRKLANAIYRILSIKLGTFLFTYLGIPISPKRLTVNQLQFIPNKVHNVIQSSNHYSLSLDGREILLNSTIFAISNHILLVMNLLVSILDCISKLARNFLWDRTSNNQGFHLKGW